jgi:hypothetical protein
LTAGEAAADGEQRGPTRGESAEGITSAEVSTMATAVSAIPLERSLSKMEAKAEGTPDLYADYKLKQREHEFLKNQVSDRAASATPARTPPRSVT